ncbi:uncharacterized protein BX663DRAFT_278160, partial [Cokeromyces recurvatus]
MSSQPTTPNPTHIQSSTTIHHSPLFKSPKLENNPISLPLEKNTVTQNNSIVTNCTTHDSVSNQQIYPSFAPTKYNQNIISMDRRSIIDVQLHTRIDRGFFLADNDWTCYRRNYFQVSGTFSLDGVSILYEGQELPCLVRLDNHFEEVECFMLGIHARL